MNKEIFEIHAIHGYCINIKPLKEGVGCLVEFPRNFDKNPFVIVYKLEENKLSVTIHVEGCESKSKELRITKELVFDYIYTDLLVHAKQLEINLNLINYEVNLNEIFPNGNLELIEYVNAMLEGNFDSQPSDSSLLNDYRMLKKIIQRGGICNV